VGVLSATFIMHRDRCRHCGQSIINVDGWIHEATGLAQCIWQPPPLVAEPDEGACA